MVCIPRSSIKFGGDLVCRAWSLCVSADGFLPGSRLLPCRLEKPTTGGVNSVVVSAEHMSDNDNKMATLLKTLFSKIVHLSESLRNFLETYAAPLPFQQRSPLVEVCKIERGVGQARRTYSTTSCHQQVVTWYFRGVHLRDQMGRCGNRQCS